VIGIGPTVWLVSHHIRRRIALSICIAPVVGLAETGLILYPITLHDVVIERASYPVAILTAGLSLLLVWLDRRRHPDAYTHIAPPNKFIAASLVFFLSAGLLLLSPFWAGPESRFWQGNAWDANGYITLAEYSKRVPVSYSLSPAQYQQAIQINPSLAPILSRGLVLARPSASNAVAWISSLYGISIYSSYYYVKLLFLILIFGVALAIATRVNLPWKWSLSSAVATTVGFWTVLVLDIDSFSELSSLSLNLLVLFAWLILEQEAPKRLISRERVFWAFALAGSMVFYPEAFALMVAATGLYYLLQIKLDFSKFAFVNLIFTALLALAFQLPGLSVTLRFTLGQRSVMGTLTEGWEKRYFPWLFESHTPLRDFWGLHFLQIPNLRGQLFDRIRNHLPQSSDAILALLSSLIGLIMSILVVWAIAQALWRRGSSPEHKMFAVLVLTFFATAAVFFLVRRQPWLAGRAVSMGMPFTGIAAVLFAHRQVRGARLFKVAVALWVILQILMPFPHAVALAYPKYGQLVEPQPVDQIQPALASVKSDPPRLLGIDLANSTSFLAHDWSFALADKTKTANLAGGGSYYLLPPSFWQASDDIPDQVLMSPERDFLSALRLGQLLVDHRPYFMLRKITPDDLDQAVMFPSVNDPNDSSGIAIYDVSQPFLRHGLEKPVRWTIQRRPADVQLPEQTVMRFWASGKTLFGIYLSYLPNFKGSIEIQANGVQHQQRTLTSSDIQQMVFCIGKPGINTGLLNYKVNELSDLGTDTDRLLLQEVLVGRNRELHVGAAAEQLLLGDGWNKAEESNARKIRWSEKVSHATILSCTPPSVLRFMAFVDNDKTNAVTLGLNGKTIGRVQMSAGWHEYAVPIPPDAYRENEKQLLNLSHDRAESSNSAGRAFAAAYEWFVFD